MKKHALLLLSISGVLAACSAVSPVANDGGWKAGCTAVKASLYMDGAKRDASARVLNEIATNKKTPQDVKTWTGLATQVVRAKDPRRLPKSVKNGVSAPCAKRGYPIGL